MRITILLKKTAPEALRTLMTMNVIMVSSQGNKTIQSSDKRLTQRTSLRTLLKVCNQNLPLKQKVPKINSASANKKSKVFKKKFVFNSKGAMKCKLRSKIRRKTHLVKISSLKLIKTKVSSQKTQFKTNTSVLSLIRLTKSKNNLINFPSATILSPTSINPPQRLNKQQLSILQKFQRKTI